MTILQLITRSDLGGAQSVVINLSNALSATNDVIVASGDGDGKLWRLLNPTIKQEYIGSLKRELSLRNDFKTILYLRKLYHRYKPDIIHLHSSKAGILGRIAFPKSKIVYTVHGFDSIRIAYRKFLPIERFLQNRCRAIVGVSNYDARNLQAERIIHNVRVVYNGITVPKPLKEDPFQKMDGFSHRILCIARLSPQKNSDLFLALAEHLPQYAFIWIGNQTEMSKPYSANVFFMGNLPNAGAYNEYADLFVLPSNYEGLPMTIIEAMSFGKPVVASNVGGISEIVTNNENGYVVENDASAFAEKIQYILENKDVYERFSQNALRRFQQDLTVDKMVNGYLTIYLGTN
jgi:glycosyltransferase involved in cell wall biosynthesis